MPNRPQKITFADMRDMGVRGLVIYCSDDKCSHPITMSGERWRDDMRLSDLELRFLWQARRRRIDDPHREVGRWDQTCLADPGATVAFSGMSTKTTVFAPIVACAPTLIGPKIFAPE